MLGRSLAPFDEPAYLALVDKLHGADLTFANLEDDGARPQEGVPSISPGTYMTTSPNLLADLKWFGIPLVSCANNHAFDYGEEGVLATCRHLDRAGIALPARRESRRGAPARLCRHAAREGRARRGDRHFFAHEPAGEARPTCRAPRRQSIALADPLPRAARGTRLRRLADRLGFAKATARMRQHFFSDKEAPADNDQNVYFLGRRFAAAAEAGIESACEPPDLPTIALDRRGAPPMNGSS